MLVEHAVGIVVAANETSAGLGWADRAQLLLRIAVAALALPVAVTGVVMWILGQTAFTAAGLGVWETAVSLCRTAGIAGAFEEAVADSWLRLAHALVGIAVSR